MASSYGIFYAFSVGAWRGARTDTHTSTSHCPVSRCETNPGSCQSSLHLHSHAPSMSDAAIRLQVAARCKPFTRPDKLGVVLRQHEPGNAEVETVNCEREVRLPFSYAWWSAYGYKDVVDQASLPPGVNSIPLVDQKACYDQVGKVMLSDLLDGHAVVLFANQC